MDKFNGFSQDEIDKVSRSKVARMAVLRDDMVARTTARKPYVGKKLPKAVVSSNINAKKTTEGSSTSETTPIEQHTLDEVYLNRSMSKSIEEALFFQPPKQPSDDHNGAALSHEINAATDTSILELSTMDNTSTCNPNADDSILVDQKCEKISDKAVGLLDTESPFKGISLKDFEDHRKMIEEQNKSKKEILYKAIELHSQKTAAETRKIEAIKNELSKLDNDLSLDVAILRKQIDNACIQFTNIEKNYMKIEAQFLKAKIDLHNAAEKKQLLTEHLCTVIAHNEDRKAQKLSELMEKVGITPTGEYVVNATNDVEK